MPTYYHDVQHVVFSSQAESKDESNITFAELRDRALNKLNTCSKLQNRKIISIRESTGYSEKRPRQDNSDTWYQCPWLTLVIYHIPD